MKKFHFFHIENIFEYTCRGLRVFKTQKGRKGKKTLYLEVLGPLELAGGGEY